MNPARLALHIARSRRGSVPRRRGCTHLVCVRPIALCGMCDSWKMKRGTEMPPQRARQVFAKIGPLEVARLRRGESVLREDFAGVATAVLEASRPWDVPVTANGSVPDRIAASLRGVPAAGRPRPMVWFDGLQTEHDAERGADVGFATAT